jgi:hypothetical protein
MVGSGSEPTYQPRMLYTSCAGLVLYFFGAASRVEAVPRITTRAIAVFVNMVGSPLFARRSHFAGARYARKHYAATGSMILTLGTWTLGTVWTIVIVTMRWLDRAARAGTPKQLLAGCCNGRFAADRPGKHAEPLSNRDSLRERLHLELLHHGMAVRFDGSL